MNHLLTPRDWQAQAQREASELLGTPEGAAKLVEAKRYGSLADEIGRLEAEKGTQHNTEKKPIAAVRYHTTGGNVGLAWSARPHPEYDGEPPREGEVLYRAANKAPVLLTDDELEEVCTSWLSPPPGALLRLMRAIEAAVLKKNGIGE